MIDVGTWLESYLQAMKNVFGERLWFVGLQGSYGRGEATESSDLDVVAVLTSVNAADIEAYRGLLDTLPHREMICGFFSGREELLHWDPADLFQFCQDTTPLLGSLDAVLAKVDSSAVSRAVRTGACNIYHGCVHNMLFQRDADTLRGLYKAATFVIRAMVYLRAGRFCRRLDELEHLAQDADALIAAAYAQMTRNGIREFGAQSETLFQWAQGVIARESDG